MGRGPGGACRGQPVNIALRELDGEEGRWPRWPHRVRMAPVQHPAGRPSARTNVSLREVTLDSATAAPCVNRFVEGVTRVLRQRSLLVWAAVNEFPLRGLRWQHLRPPAKAETSQFSGVELAIPHSRFQY
jgi:hypothetical protein